MYIKEDRWIFTPDFFMGHWYVAISECETDPIFKKITVNYEKNAYEKSVNFWELCEALQWEWCLYDVCSTRLYCYDLHLLPAVQKVQPASQAEAVTSLNNFTVPGLFQACTSHAFTPHSTQILKYDDRNVFLHQKNFETEKRILRGQNKKKANKKHNSVSFDLQENACQQLQLLKKQ